MITNHAGRPQRQSIINPELPYHPQPLACQKSSPSYQKSRVKTPHFQAYLKRSKISTLGPILASNPHCGTAPEPHPERRLL